MTLSALSGRLQREEKVTYRQIAHFHGISVLGSED